MNFEKRTAEPAATATTGAYELSIQGESCNGTASDFSSSKLPVDVVSDEGESLSWKEGPEINDDERIHEMLQCDPSHGTAVHQFSDQVFEDDHSL